MNIYEAVDENDAVAVRNAIDSGEDVSAPELLERAIMENTDCEIVRMLIEAGCNPNAEVSGKPVWFNCLPGESWDAEDEFSTDMLDCLLAAGADLHAVGDDTALGQVVGSYYAAPERSIEPLKVLLLRGIDVNIKNRYGNTALHETCERLRHDIAVLLLDTGAEINAFDSNKHTPLLILCHSSHDDENIDKIVAMVRLLLEHGADSNLAHYGSPLMVAAEQGQMHLAETLLEYGADINYTLFMDEADNSALTLALENGHFEAAEWLKEHGAVEPLERYKRSRLAGLVKGEDWEGVITLAPDVIKAFPDNWLPMHQLGHAYNSLDNYTAAVKWMRRGLEIEYSIYLLEGLFFALNNLGCFEEALQAWEMYRDKFDVKHRIACSSITHLLVACIMLNRAADVVAEIELLVADLEYVKENGFLYFNMCCLHVRAGNNGKALEYLQQALLQGYDPKKVQNDDDLKSIRNLPAYRILLEADNLEHRFFRSRSYKMPVNAEYLDIELILRDTKIIRRRRKKDDSLPVSETQEYENPMKALFAYLNECNRIEEEGGKEALSQVETQWIKELDEYFGTLAQKQEESDLGEIGALCMGWDDVYEPDSVSYWLSVETYDDVDVAEARCRKYHSTDDFTLDEKDLAIRDQIYSRDSFQTIINGVVRSDGFKRLKKKPVFFFSHEEGDTAVEFWCRYPEE